MISNFISKFVKYKVNDFDQNVACFSYKQNIYKAIESMPLKLCKIELY